MEEVEISETVRLKMSVTTALRIFVRRKANIMQKFNIIAIKHITTKQGITILYIWNCNKLLCVQQFKTLRSLQQTPFYVILRIRMFFLIIDATL